MRCRCMVDVVTSPILNSCHPPFTYQVLSHNVDAYVGTDIPRMVRKIHKEARYVVEQGGIQECMRFDYGAQHMRPLPFVP